MIEQWLLVAAVVLLWIHLGRDWTWIGLRAPGSASFWLALGTAIAIGTLLALQNAVVVRRPDRRAEVRGAMAPMVEMLPVHRTDLTGFIAVSLTAGVCEELLFRGWMGWYLGAWLGPWGGQAAALVLFGAGHLYLGPTGAVRAFLMGAAFAGLYLWSGSLLPSVLLHAAVDASSGWLAYQVLREPPPAAAPAT